MKYLFSFSTVLVFILSSCANVPASVQENLPTATAFIEEGAPLETNSGGNVSVEVIGGDEESLREFIKQWLVPVQTDGSSQDMIVYIGSLPKELPYDLPIPEDAHMVGSITGSWVDYLLIFDTRLSSKAIHTFYAENLTGQGWQEAPANAGPGGFISSTDLFSGYCHEAEDAFLNVETGLNFNGQTSVRLNLDISPPPFNCDASAISSGSLYEKLMPQLETPGGTIVQSGGASSSDHEAEITAHLQSDLSPLQLVEFYNEQLLAFGWKMQDSGDVQGSGNGEGAAWSHWTFTDEQENNWHGSLIVVKTSANSDKLFALLRIEKGK